MTLSKSARHILISGSLILALSLGLRHAFGLFLQPMTLDHGWSRELFSFSIALQNLLWGVFQPFAGAFADRHGAGRTLVGGALLYILGLVIMAHADSALGLNLGAGLLIGMGLSGTTFSVVLGVIGRMAAPEKRSLALGIASAGGSFGQFAVLPVGQGLITAFGWQDALLWMAVGIAFIIPLAAAVTGTSERGGGVEQSLRQALAEAMRTPSFHFLFWSFFVCGFQTAFVMLHLPAYVVDMGLSANIGMSAVAMIGLFNIFGSFLSGWLGGLYSKKWLLAWIYALRIVAILALMLFPLTDDEVKAALYGPVPQAQVSGGLYFDISIIASADNGQSYAEIDNARVFRRIEPLVYGSDRVNACFDFADPGNHCTEIAACLTNDGALLLLIGLAGGIPVVYCLAHP
mgnify:CR=1 FL=1